MQIAGVREFRNHAPQLLGGKDIIFVTKHGKPLSMVVPLKNTKSLPLEVRGELLERLGAAISGHLHESGVSEKEILEDFKAWRKERRAGRRRR